jgi:uncharacterized protein
MTLPSALSPTGDKERIDSVDIVRGVALLGILLMNIAGLGLSNAYSDPTISGGATGWNLKVWWINNMFFEGTMRGMFSMLFGAGIILFTSRTTRVTNGVTVTDAYFRRMLWLFLFGVIHAYVLLWHGEVLYPYALIGLFAFSFRNWEPKHLIAGAVFLLLVSTALATKDYYHSNSVYEKSAVALVKKTNGQVLAKEDSASVDAWKALVAERKPSPEKIKEDIVSRHKGYFSILMDKASMNQFMQTYIMYRYFFWDMFSMMLLGMAFLKNGIFRATKSNSYYLMLALAGYSIGLATNYLETSYVVSNQFAVIPMERVNITYDLGRVFTTFGHVAVIMLFIKSGILPFLQRALAAVGQMAFTNYIMQTIICNTIFLGFGFGLYGMLERYELYYIVFGIWILQLIWSPVWLHYFRFGPLEWGWRSLTYWEKQPFKKTST